MKKYTTNPPESTQADTPHPFDPGEWGLFGKSQPKPFPPGTFIPDGHPGTYRCARMAFVCRLKGGAARWNECVAQEGGTTHG